jgi:choline-sulfatase
LVSRYYVDRKLGELRETLGAAGIADDTVIILTSDHGDMIGERGLWFKKNLFEPAIRVPLVIYRPGRKGLPRVAAPVSLIDVMPTLVEIGTGSTEAIVTEHEGSSLLPLLSQDDPGRAALSEHIDGGTVAPRVMLRQGARKIVVSEAYPTQFYDLAADPGETRDLSGDSSQRDAIARMTASVRETWDLPRLRQDVMRSQRVRQFVNRAMQKGKARDWEHYPDAIREHTKFVRTGERFPDVERRSYLPYGDY